MNRCNLLNSLTLKFTWFLTPMIMYTIPFKYLLETVHWDWPSIALDNNYIQNKYFSWNLDSNLDIRLSFLLLSIGIACVKKYFLLIMICNIQDRNSKSSFLSKGVKRWFFPQAVYFLHHILVWIILALLVFFSTSGNTFHLLGINLGF